ncbi:hypothetical protein [Helicobacter ganmani]|uniref:hypothetical protein n=1 Tax=Helicobacter ganmani TaxID=60246 RepID=UPI003A8A7844
MDITELIVNLRAEVAKLNAMIKRINEQINEIESLCKKEGLTSKTIKRNHK